MSWSSAARLALGAALPLCAAVTAQQAGSIRGVVRDKDFDVPLSGVEVLAVENGQRVHTSEQGNYVFPALPPGRYTIVFAKEGYVRSVQADVVVQAGQLTDVHAALAGDFTEMEEFLVQDVLQLGGATELALLELRLDSPALMDSIGAGMMSRAGASNAADAVRLVPGASLQGGKSAVIRGLPDRYVSSQMNNVRLPTADEDKRAVELDQFPTEVLDSIQISKTFTPDQQGDASGGAVNVRLKGVPDDPFFFKWRLQTTHNTQVTGRNTFRSYEGGGVHFFGKDGGDRTPQLDRIGQSWEGAVGSYETGAPTDHKMAAAIGGRGELFEGVEFGGFLNVFHERDSALYTDGVDESWWVERPGAPMTPKVSQGTVSDGDFKTALYDITQAKQSVKWGTLTTFGVASENHIVSFVHLYTRTAEDKVTLAEDTRGKQYFFPGYDPNNQNSPGFFELNAAPWIRLETLDYTERTTETFQLNGRHRLAGGDSESGWAPELDWTLAHSSAHLLQPDKRQFGSLWTPEIDLGTIFFPAVYTPYKPSANFTLGNLQRIWKEIEEESDQVAVNLKVPFELFTEEPAYVKFGWFSDELDRTFDQDTYSNFSDNSQSEGPWEVPWSRTFPGENHPITASTFDVDYRGRQDIQAWYAMLETPLGAGFSLVGGVRFEGTKIDIVNDAEADATWFPPGSTTQTELNPGDADVAFSAHDVLPSIGLAWTPVKELTLRASYNETVARQTFKELTPILQQEYLGGPVFVGNPDLRMSSLRNYDFRTDWVPYEGGLLSASWFQKDIHDPIEYVQRISTFDFTTATNYPRGTIRGYELEVRQALGHWWDAIEGIAVGANATFLHSSVRLPDDEILAFQQPNIQAPMSTREMTNAPDHLYNFYITWDLTKIGTQLALFYTVQGDSLVAGAGESAGNFVPSVYELGYDTLNFSLSQQFGPHIRLSFAAKNLTDPDREEVYRSDYIGADVTKTKYSEGVEFSVGIGGEVVF